ncbi:TPA: serine/threonine-protein phosphatase [Escherichia coli]|nr:serine/threonine-protein phosphatase [Escherichia coli]
MKQPAPVYQRIAGHQWRHIWLSGDIHGCLEQLRRKLWHCGFDPWRDLLISVGDVIDRGPQSLRCLQLLEQHWVRAVRGNHEQMAMDALADNQQKQAKTALEKCQHLPFILEVHSRTGKHVIAHADYPDDVYEWQKDVDLHQVLWSRSRLGERQKGQGITGADHFWFGHTPLRHRVDIGNLHYIDTGAVFGGELTLVQLQ